MPSRRSSLLRVQRNQRTMSMIGPITAIRRSTYEDERNGSGAIVADTPRIMSVFMRLDPTILPTAISVLPRRAARTDVTISGALVPMATMVRPMMDCESPAIVARSTAPSTSIFPQRKSTNIPPVTQSTAFHEEETSSTTSSISGITLL